MLVSDFDYFLPSELIAQGPLAARDDSRMLHLDRISGKMEDRGFRDFPELLRRDDLLIFNNTRVFPARLLGRKEGNLASRSAKVEVLLTKQLSTDPDEWDCLVKPGRKVKRGDFLCFGESGYALRAKVTGHGSFGERRLRFDGRNDFFSTIERFGHVPLPPYIPRPDASVDIERYQTVYAREKGSVAAPTAGLHFTAETIQQIKSAGVEVAEITLHIGLGTFQPVRGERVEDHKIHRETYQISGEAVAKINAAREQHRRVIAVGTTTVRTLEYSANLSSDGRVQEGRGESDIFIYPGYKFKVVDGMLTNFHLPQSTLLMLISAFAGREQVLTAYEHAVAEKYRFYSYGDCMFIE